MPRGFSIHLAINDYCQADGGTCRGTDLFNCLDSGDVLFKLAFAQGFEPSKPGGLQFHVDGSATYATLNQDLSDIKEVIQDGDYLLVTFAGYGIHPSIFSDMKSSRGWMLSDQDLRLDELFTSLAGFPAGVRILVVSNSCLSGGISAALIRGARWIVQGLRSLRGAASAEPTAAELPPPPIIHLAGCAGDDVMLDSPEFANEIDRLLRGGTPSFTDFFNALQGALQTKPSIERITPALQAFEDVGPFRLV
jgi:hypothetical protein